MVYTEGGLRTFEVIFIKQLSIKSKVFLLFTFYFLLKLLQNIGLFVMQN